MIEGFRHRGLKRLFEADDRSRVPAEYVGRLRVILAALDAAERVEDMDIHTFRLHALKGDLKGYWGVEPTFVSPEAKLISQAAAWLSYPVRSGRRD
jgi:proteic killer suppression protein